MIEKIKLYFIPVLISLVVGFGLGLKLSSISAKAEKYDAVTDVRKQDTKSVEQSLKTDEKIQSQIEAGNQVADDAAAKVSQTPVLGSDQNVKVIYKTKWKTKVVQCERDPHLSVGTVGLLNDARRGTPNNSPQSAMQRAKPLPLLESRALSKETSTSPSDTTNSQSGTTP